MTHLIIIQGDQRGRDLEVLGDGLRVGRSHANDVVVADKAVSQFHCRFFFKSDQTLWVTDFASTNATLVNGQPITETRLTVGDQVEIGNEVLRVVCDTRMPGLSDSGTLPPDPPQPPAGEAPLPHPETPPKVDDHSFDLGLGRHEQVAAAARPVAGLRWHRIGWTVLSIALIGGLAWLALQVITPEPDPVAPARADIPPLRLFYEKVEAGPENIFRYALQIEDNEIRVQIDDLNNHRHVTREKELDPRIIESFLHALQESGFAELRPEYIGVARGLYNLHDLTIIIGPQAQRVRVLNRVEPDAFRRVRESIEELSRTELGLAALALSPERLRTLARNAYLEGRKRLEEREARYGNLAEAIRQFTLVEWYLDTIEPKPDYYAAALQDLDRATQLLEERYNDHWFRAERATTLNDWEEAARHLRIIMELIPDRRDERHERAETRLLTVERHLRR